MIAKPIAARLREIQNRLSRLHDPASKRHSRDPDAFHQEKSELVLAVGECAMYLEGQWDLVPAPAPDPKTPTRPASDRIQDRKGNVVVVDFHAKKVLKRE